MLDIIDVDQYGRLLVDIRGAYNNNVADPAPSLESLTFARECVASGWAYPTTQHVMPEFVSAAFQEAQMGHRGAWGLQTDERPFKGLSNQELLILVGTLSVIE